MTYYRDYAKHLIKKLIGKPEPFWPARAFEHGISASTIAGHGQVLSWASARAKEMITPQPGMDMTDPIVAQGQALRQSVLQQFHGSQRQSKLRIAIHVPAAHVSPAGYSLFTNLAEALDYLGIATFILAWNEPIGPLFARVQPNVFLTSDHATYLNTIDWQAVAEYQTNHELRIGLTASLQEYGNTPLGGRLVWAKAHKVDFYYSFRDRSYLESKPEYQAFRQAGYEIYEIPFGANPLIHYPLYFPEFGRDLDYVFLASNQARHKGKRYLDYLGPITHRYHGFIDGPGWKHAPHFAFNRNRDRYIYARSKAGLNIHLPEQTVTANETNERTYQLAACGVPIITDHAKILDTLFSPQALFIAETPKQYYDCFRTIMNDRKEAIRRALIAQREVFGKYTTFHRARDFVRALEKHYKKTVN